MVDSRMLLRCIHPLIFIFITKTKTNFTDKDKDSFKPQGLSKDHKLGDGCYHIFLDVGSNIGVHTRFLYEPDLYPDAKTSISIFEKEFGVHRNNTDFCAFGFEPNPAHENRHKMLMNEYDKMGGDIITSKLVYQMRMVISPFTGRVIKHTKSGDLLVTMIYTIIWIISQCVNNKTRHLAKR